MSDEGEKKMIDQENKNGIDPFDCKKDDAVPPVEAIERQFDADDRQLHDVLGFLEEELEKHGAGMKQIMAITLSMEEAFVNVAHYAYEGIGDGTGKVWISMEFEDDTVIIVMKDQGMEFDPLAKEDPDITAEAEYRKVGGLGIYMIKQSMDSVMYQRKDGYNILTMKKVYR